MGAYLNCLTEVNLREPPFDFYGGGGGGGGDVFGPGYFFRLRRDPVFLFANNTKPIVEIFLSWIFFSGKLGPGFFFFKNLPPPPPPIKIKWSLPNEHPLC